MEASQPGKRAGPLSETNVWLVFIWESQPGKRAECFGSNAHARKERAKIAFVNMAPRVKSSLIPAALHVLTAVSLVFQLYGIIIMWKVNELRRNQAVFTDILRKRNYFIQKMKHRKQRALNRSKRSCWYKKGRTDLWWKNLINGVADEESWNKNFRMSRGSFMYLVDELRPHISPDQRSPNNRALTAEKKLGLTLYFLKDTGSIRMTANTFGVAVCTASMTVTEVCKAISSNLGPKYIYLPKDIESMRKKVSEFEANFGMTQAFGCVDGTHIPIKRPSENSQDYFCYKQYFSLNIQAVCDYRGFFMDVECKWPGSVHDAKVFANSSINAKLRDNKLPTTYQSPVSSGVKVPSYLIGDPAYPLLPFCMKEYDTCARDEQVIFNNLLRSARNPIECAFGRLKARWAILTRSMNFKLEEMPTIIYACFVLHNFCEKQNAYIDQDVVNSQVVVIKRNEAQFKNIPDPTYSYNEDEGNVIRKILTDIVLQNM